MFTMVMYVSSFINLNNNVVKLIKLIQRLLNALGGTDSEGWTIFKIIILKGTRQGINNAINKNSFLVFINKI